MTGLKIQILVDDAPVQAALAQLARRGEDLTPAMDEIGSMLVTSTQMRFEQGEDPDGAPWPPSLRAIIEGGQTLIDSGRLRDSITHQAGPDHVDVGSNVIYAAIHQLGGRVEAKSKPFLVFELGGRTIFTKAVNIPARPYLGVSEGDRQEIVEILRDHLLPGSVT